MPILTRWYIKTSMFFFVLALAMGVLLALQPVWKLPLPLSGFFPVYLHLLVLGWLTELIFGVAYWMFPKHTRDNPRGSELLGWASYLLLNGGLLLRMVAEPLNSQGDGSAWGWALVVSATLQWLAGLAFVANSWPRVKEK